MIARSSTNMARIGGHVIMNMAAAATARSMSTVAKAVTAAAAASATLPMPSLPSFKTSPAAATMPPGFTATVGQLETFVLPEQVSGSVSDQAMARAMVDAWRRDGILQVGMSQLQRRLYQAANAASRRFFGRPQGDKHACVDARSYAGYIASGEEITDGVADYSEIFTVTKDLPPRDRRVAGRWPCHGPCPWPDRDMKAVVGRYMADLGASGEKILRLIELGLGVPTGSLTRYTNDGWHHMRVLR